MVETTLEYPDMRTSLHQFVEIIEGAVRGEWNIAVLAHHNLDLHTALYGSVKGFLYAVGEGEIRVENLDAILCRVDGTTIEMSHHLISLMRLTVCYSHHFMICRGCGVRFQVVEIVSLFLTEILLSVDSLACDALPHPQEYALESIYLLTIETAMHIVP